MGFFYLLDYVTPTEFLQISDSKKKKKQLHVPYYCNFYVVCQT